MAHSSANDFDGLEKSQDFEILSIFKGIKKKRPVGGNLGKSFLRLLLAHYLDVLASTSHEAVPESPGRSKRDRGEGGTPTYYMQLF